MLEGELRDPTAKQKLERAFPVLVPVKKDGAEQKKSFGWVHQNSTNGLIA